MHESICIFFKQLTISTNFVLLFIRYLHAGKFIIHLCSESMIVRKQKYELDENSGEHEPSLQL